MPSIFLFVVITCLGNQTSSTKHQEQMAHSPSSSCFIEYLDVETNQFKRITPHDYFSLLATLKDKDKQLREALEDIEHQREEITMLQDILDTVHE